MFWIRIYTFIHILLTTLQIETFEKLKQKTQPLIYPEAGVNGNDTQFIYLYASHNGRINQNGSVREISDISIESAASRRDAWQ
jgi:hypothetical protein